jgi:GNAT superfamily N-acetyltransferase
VIIRPAVLEDWPLIWPFFSSTVAAGESYAFPPDLTLATGRDWWMSSAPSLTVVATSSSGEVLGSAKMGPNRPGRGDHIGTGSFMVSPAARGQGVGRSLGLYVIDWHRAAGFRGIQFNAVVETNTAAVRLWTSLGFEIVGTVPRAFRSVAHGEVGLHVMFLAL